MNKNQERLFAYIFGVIFVTALLIVAVSIPNPTKFQYEFFRIVLALSCAGVAGFIPGFLNVKLKEGLRAGGALAVFVVIYFFSPAQLVAEPPRNIVEIPILTERDVHLGDNVYPQSMGYNHIPVNQAIYPQPNKDIVFFNKETSTFFTIDGSPTVIGYQFLSGFSEKIEGLDFSAYSRISVFDESNSSSSKGALREKGSGDRFVEFGPTFLYEDQSGKGNYYEKYASVSIIKPFHLKSHLSKLGIKQIASAEFIIKAYHGGIREGQAQNFYLYVNGSSFEIPASRDWPRKVEEISLEIPKSALDLDKDNVLAIYVLPWEEELPKFISPINGELVSPVHFRDVGILGVNLLIKS